MKQTAAHAGILPNPPGSYALSRLICLAGFARLYAIFFHNGAMEPLHYSYMRGPVRLTCGERAFVQVTALASRWRISGYCRTDQITCAEPR
jgi:hypothetical protein